VQLSQMKNLLSLTLILLMMSNVIAQIFPVQVNVYLAPPYSPYLSDYTTPGSQSIVLHIQLNDQTVTDYRCRLKIAIEGGGIALRSNATDALPPIVLHGGGVGQEFSGSDIAAYFHPDAINFSGISRSEYTQRAR